MKREELETIADENLNEVSGGCFLGLGMGMIARAIVDSIMGGAGMHKPSGGSDSEIEATPLDPSGGQTRSSGWKMGSS